MARVLTNNVNLAYSIETAVGTAGTSWFNLEPNTITTYGAEITKVSREPISKTRQRRKAVVTDLDSSVEFEHDLTLAAFMDFVEGYCFATAVNIELDIPSTNVDGTNDEFDVAALSATQAGKLQWTTGDFGSLIYGRGFTNSANNGLHVLDADPATSATAIGVTTDLTDEASPPANAQIELAGVRSLDGTTNLTFAYSGTTLTITRGAGALDFTTLGLTVGQLIHVGSPDGSSGIQNALQDSVANDTYGYARITAIAAASLTCDKVDTTLQVASPTVPATVDILFGKFVRNVGVDDADYLERSFHFEAAYPDLGGVGTDEYHYSKGNFCNTMAFSLPLTDKAVVTFGLTGTDTDNPTTTRKSGAASAVDPAEVIAFSSSIDIARLRTTELDEDGLMVDFKSLTLTLNNNITPQKCLGTLGATAMNAGFFMVDIESQALFVNGDVVDKIRNNETVTMDFIVKNEDGAIGVDIPAMTMGGGGLDLPVNESVLINTTAEAFEDPTLGTSIGISVFPVAP